MKTTAATETLTPEQMAALAGCIAPKPLADAKRSIAAGSSTQVDFTVAVRGTVQKGVDEAPSETEVPATFNLMTPEVCAEVMRRLKCTPDQLKRLLKSIASKMLVSGKLPSPDAREELLGVFDTVSDQVAAKLPKEKQTRPGRAGAVRVSASCELVN